jgi:hypothetical protein
MEITEAQYQHIASSLPRQRGNVKLPNPPAFPDSAAT